MRFADGRTSSFLVALAGLLSMGCVETMMTARQSNAAVLLGPVSCIGCQPRPMPAPPESSDPDDVAPGTVVDLASAERSAAGGGGMTAAGSKTRFSMIDIEADIAVPDPCRGQLRVTRIRASRQATFLVFGAFSKATLRLEALPVRVPGGSCGPRPWPYSGPKGIVTFDEQVP